MACTTHKDLKALAVRNGSGIFLPGIALILRFLDKLAAFGITRLCN
jgi:hypothetical protein